MRKLLDALYQDIKNYEAEKEERKKEVENIEKEIESLISSLNSGKKFRKIEKLKKQVDLSYLESKLELIEIEKSNNLTIENDIKSKLKKLEDAIYIAVRFNDLKYLKAFEELREKNGKEDYRIFSIKKFFDNNCKKEIKTELIPLPELFPIYEYYKKVSDIEDKIIEPYVKKKNSKPVKEQSNKKRTKNVIKAEEKLASHKAKLDMLNELIEEMTAEVITKDMIINGVKLPNFITEVKYFNEKLLKIYELINLLNNITEV